jgi:hypothetical protein
MFRITSTEGCDDGLSMRRQRIRTKFGTKISWGMSTERLKRRSMDNISIHIRSCEYGGWVNWLKIILSGRM